MDPTWCLFPKFYRHLSPEELAGLLAQVGLDETAVVVRDGYSVTHEALASELPGFLRALRGAGGRACSAVTNFMPAGLVADPTPLAVMADNGITEFRMGCFWYDGPDVRGVLARCREEMRRLAPVCRRHGVRCVYQLHHNSLVANSAGAYALVRNLPAEAIGVMIDPGNQSHDGWENWHRSARLLGEYLAGVGVKDTAVARDPSAAGDPSKGWQRTWCPLDEGVTDWHDVAGALAGVDFAGTFLFMPFYDPDDPDGMIGKLKREVRYLRNIVAEADRQA